MLHPKPNRNPAQAVAIWKEGARERADDVFFCHGHKKTSEQSGLCSDVVPVVGLEPTRYRYQRILSYSSHSEPNGLNRNKTVFSVTFQNIKNPKKPYKISIFDAKHQKYKQFVPSSIIGNQIPNLRRWRDVGGM